MSAEIDRGQRAIGVPEKILCRRVFEQVNGRAAIGKLHDEMRYRKCRVVLAAAASPG